MTDVMTEQRVLSIRQPWATLLLVEAEAGVRKDVENRSRNVAGSWRGRVAIHASLERDYRARIPWAAVPMRAEIVDTFPRGAIIGTVDLIDVHHADDCNTDGQAACSPWADAHCFHLVTASPRPLAEPIPFKGALGLRTLPVDVADLVAAAPTWRAE